MIEKKLYQELKQDNKIYKIKCDSGSHFINCPNCENKMLRAWETKKGIVILCYDCGNLFNKRTKKTIKTLKGNKHTWGSQSLCTIKNYEDYIEKYKNKTLEKRKLEYGAYLKTRQLENGYYTEHELTQITDLEMLRHYQICADCGDEMYNDEQLHHAIIEYDSPENTFKYLEAYIDNHYVENYLEKEYEPLEYGEDTWRLSEEEYPSLFISPEMREYFAKKIAEIYKEWVNLEKINLITHENDPDWDTSGELVEVPVQKITKLSSFSNLTEWMFNAYNGESYPTYQSGCGIGHETYFDTVMDYIDTDLWRLWTKKLTENQAEALYDELEDKDLLDKMADFVIELINLIGDMTTIEAYKLN